MQMPFLAARLPVCTVIPLLLAAGCAGSPDPEPVPDQMESYLDDRVTIEVARDWETQEELDLIHRVEAMRPDADSLRSSLEKSRTEGENVSERIAAALEALPWDEDRWWWTDVHGVRLPVGAHGDALREAIRAAHAFREDPADGTSLDDPTFRVLYTASVRDAGPEGQRFQMVSLRLRILRNCDLPEGIGVQAEVECELAFNGTRLAQVGSGGSLNWVHDMPPRTVWIDEVYRSGRLNVN